MKNTILFLFSILISFPSFGQKEKPLLGGNEINIRVLFLSPYYEFGADGMNHFGIGGGVGIYKQFFGGVYHQWGKWTTPLEGSDFESKYNHGGVWLGHIASIKKSKFSIVTSCYLGIGKSTSEQNTPIDFTDAQIQFRVITPELGLEYRMIPFGTLMLSTGYHTYASRDDDDFPLGFDGFELNRYYTKLSLRIGL